MDSVDSSFCSDHILFSYFTSWVLPQFVFCGFACRNYAYDAILIAQTMANQKHPQLGTDSKEKKSVFPFGMYVIVEFYSVFIVKYHLGFIEPNTMLAMVFTIL